MERTQKRGVKSGAKFKTKAREDCKLCENKVQLTYKQPDELKRYMNKLGKILPRRASRLCAKHQRRIAREIKRARQMALIPYGSDHQ
ncbi:MAG: 30S ribosomal protein S18 [Candidatus Bipolaricaulota bacterium]|nr:30S ribosomal protein S18 [Candidatus Bipolaricaulota bacterium]MDW8141279.1 30S ribosomal protein S18 [Candidatus Bipolaricaulota bacterium]